MAQRTIQPPVGAVPASPEGTRAGALNRTAPAPASEGRTLENEDDSPIGIDNIRRQRRRGGDDRRQHAARRRRPRRLVCLHDPLVGRTDPRRRGCRDDASVNLAGAVARRPLRRAGRDRLAERRPLLRRDPDDLRRPGARRPRRRRLPRADRRQGRALRRHPVQEDGQGDRGRATEHDRARRRRRAGRAARGRGARRGARLARQEGRGRAHRQRGLGARRHGLRCRPACLPPPGRCRRPERAPVEHHRQRSRRPGRGARRHPLRRRLPDHPGHRGARVARTQPRQARRRAGAGRGRARLDQPDHRRLLCRRALADRDLRPRPRPDDRIARPRGRLGDPDHRGQRDARRPLHRHPGQVRAERPQHRALRPARRRSPPRGGAQLARRLRLLHPVGGPSRRQPADRRDRALRPVPGAEPGDDRAPARPGLSRDPPDARGRGGRTLPPLHQHRIGRLADGGAGHEGLPVHRRRPRAQRVRHPVQRRRRPQRTARQAPAQARRA